MGCKLGGGDVASVDAPYRRATTPPRSVSSLRCRRAKRPGSRPAFELQRLAGRRPRRVVEGTSRLIPEERRYAPVVARGHIWAPRCPVPGGPHRLRPCPDVYRGGGVSLPPCRIGDNSAAPTGPDVADHSTIARLQIGAAERFDIREAGSTTNVCSFLVPNRSFRPILGGSVVIRGPDRSADRCGGRAPTNAARSC
jgi:hypothetical protein